jgi:hypothetical protein
VPALSTKQKLLMKDVGIKYDRFLAVDHDVVAFKVASSRNTAMVTTM